MRKATKDLLFYGGLAASALMLMGAGKSASGTAGVGDAASDAQAKAWHKWMRQFQNQQKRARGGVSPSNPWWRWHYNDNGANGGWGWNGAYAPAAGSGSTFDPYSGYGGYGGGGSTFDPYSGGGYGGFDPYGYGGGYGTFASWYPSAVDLEQPGSIATQSASIDASYGGS